MSPGGAGRSLPCVSFDPGTCAPALAETSPLQSCLEGTNSVKKRPKNVSGHVDVQAGIVQGGEDSGENHKCLVSSNHYFSA